MNIKISDIKNLCKLILDKIEKIEGKEIYFEYDFYWVITQPECFDITKKTELLIGSTFDDIDDLKCMLTGEYSLNSTNIGKMAIIFTTLASIVASKKSSHKETNIIKNIKINEIRNLYKLILDCLEESEGDDIDCEHDFYWIINQPECFDINEDPKILVGSISNDINDLRTMLLGEDYINSINIEKMSIIFRLIADYIDTHKLLLLGDDDDEIS